MAGVAFASRGNLEVSMKEDGGALFRIGQALHGLLSGLVSSLEEFRDVGNTLESESAAGIGDSNSDEARPQLLLSVAGAVKEMVETLVSDIRSNPAVQELLPVVQKYSGADQRAFYDLFQDLAIPQQPRGDRPSSLVDIPPLREEMLGCVSSNDLRTAKRAARMGQRICKHSCEDHPELVDPGLWRNLPQEIVELVFAKLPLPRIMNFCETYDVSSIQFSPTWPAMSKSESFREAFTERHPKLFGLLGCDPGMFNPWVTIHDIKSKEWFWFELAGFPGGREINDMKHDIATLCAYRNYIYSCDGGLVCFVPLMDFTSSILVCNPLSCMWKALPLLPLSDFEIIMVQLIMGVDRKCYKVILVGEVRVGKAYSAHVYNSRTGVWSILESGLVYGVDTCWTYDHGVSYLFDCSTKELVDLRDSASLDGLEGVLAYSVAKDRLFVLHESSEKSVLRGNFMYAVSEFTWESSISDLRILSVSETPIQVWPEPYKIMLFASPSTVLVFADNCEECDEDHHQIIGRYDVTGKQWDILPPAHNIHYEQLQQTFICELRWNVSP